jgi:hypothetical protein
MEMLALVRQNPLSKEASQINYCFQGVACFKTKFLDLPD